MPISAQPSAPWHQSVWLAVAVNLVPLLGVLFLGWSTGVVLFLYWAENVVVGLVTLLKMFACTGEETQFEKLRNMAFFFVHYGAFAVGHAVGLLVLVGLDGHADLPEGEQPPPPEPGSINPTWLALTLLGIVVSHLFDFYNDFLVRGEGRDKTSSDLLFRPYVRVVILHLVVVLGAFVCLKAGSPTPAVVMLVLLKTGIDLALHYGRKIWAAA